MDYEGAIFLWHVDKKDFLLWTITSATTLFLGIEIGVLVGVCTLEISALTCIDFSYANQHFVFFSIFCIYIATMYASMSFVEFFFKTLLFHVFSAVLTTIVILFFKDNSTINSDFNPKGWILLHELSLIWGVVLILF